MPETRNSYPNPMLPAILTHFLTKKPAIRHLSNPATGSFSVQVTITEILTPLVAEIRNMFGTLLEKVTLQDLRHHIFDLSGKPNGA